MKDSKCNVHMHAASPALASYCHWIDCVLHNVSSGPLFWLLLVQPQWIGGGKPRLDVCFIINIETRQVLLRHMASSSCGPRVKQHGERWDVITQSVCAILIKTLLTVLHYWNTPHRTLLNSLNKLAPALLIIHRTMSTFFFFFPPPQRGYCDKKPQNWGREL